MKPVIIIAIIGVFVFGIGLGFSLNVSAEEDIPSEATFERFGNDTIKFEEVAVASDSVRIWIANSTYSEAFLVFSTDAQMSFSASVVKETKTCIHHLDNLHEMETTEREEALESYDECVNEDVENGYLDKKFAEVIATLTKQNEDLKEQIAILIKETGNQSEEIKGLSQDLRDGNFMTPVYVIISIVGGAGVTFLAPKIFCKIKSKTVNTF